jgi:hypothetical protein
MARYNITNGPSKWDLMLSLFDGDYRHRREALFFLQLGTIKDAVPFLINELAREGESGECWNFKGLAGSHRCECHGFFSIKNRKGWVQMEEYER